VVRYTLHAKKFDGLMLNDKRRPRVCLYWETQACTEVSVCKSQDCGNDTETSMHPRSQKGKMGVMRQWQL
jgi:hypothetical protein